MSHRSGYQHGHAARHDGHGQGNVHGGAYHAAARKPQAVRHPPRSHERGYTLNHAGHQVRLGPVAFWIFVGTVVIMAGWSVVTATYFAFRDDVLTRLIARQHDMQYAYEDRIADLRAQVDRITSRQLIDQEQFEKKLDAMLRRQSLLEQRAATLSSLPDLAATGSIRQAARSTVPASAARPAPAGDTVIFVPPPDREARLESRKPMLATAPQTMPATGKSARADGVGGLLTRLQSSLDAVENRQAASLGALEDALESRSRRMRGVFTDLGLDLAEMQAAAPRGGTGGPFVAIKPAADAGSFERQLYRVNLGRAQIDRLTRTLALVPYRKPVLGDVETTSGFGVRSDPFLGRPAMHTGLDFRAASGDPVRATANGKVTNAGWAGGYGRMVEIDHGNGLATRYGHLSEIEVATGETVKIGQVIGAVGSTGRSTGPHLHYETRVDGDPVDPQKFLRAGVRLGGG
ncbi:MAG: M23 family peptidase [Xanthobacteraceae bacterium]|nr:MAG: M23 family peptidase [Xanthobacteraceae bacterium]